MKNRLNEDIPDNVICPDCGSDDELSFNLDEYIYTKFRYYFCLNCETSFPEEECREAFVSPANELSVGADCPNCQAGVLEQYKNGWLRCSYCGRVE